MGAELVAMYGEMQVMCGPAGCAPSCAEMDYARALSKWAKVELLKEKVKQKLDAKYGKQLDKVADLIVEIMTERAKSQVDFAQKQQELETALGEMASDEEGE